MRIPCPFPKCTTIILSKGLLPAHYAKVHPGKKVPVAYRPKMDAKAPIKRALKKLKKMKPRRYARSAVVKHFSDSQAAQSWVKPEGDASRMRSIAQGLESKAATMRQMADELDNLS
jgi:hypothetical protein